MVSTRFAILRGKQNETHNFQTDPDLDIATQLLDREGGERPEDTDGVYRMFEEAGFADRLMFSSDYPHWDFDSPYQAVPQSFPIERRRRLLGENASRLFRIPLKPDSGIPAVVA